MKNDDHDNIWINCSLFNTNNHKFQNIPRADDIKGGGIIWNSNNLTCKLETTGSLSSLQYGVWKIKTKTKSFHLLILYHPPMQERGKSNTVFCDEFCEIIDQLTMTYENLIYTDDFNIHVNNSQDADSMQFRDMIEALGSKHQLSYT